MASDVPSLVVPFLRDVFEPVRLVWMSGAHQHRLATKGLGEITDEKKLVPLE